MRYKNFLKERYQALCGYIGAILSVIGAVFLLPLLAMPFYPEEVTFIGAFVVAGGPLVIGGLGLRWRFVPKGTVFSISLQEGMVVVVVSWVVASVIGALPFMLTIDLTLTQAVFEAVSGWTTTGLSVVDVESAPRSVLLYRSILQSAGGAGFVILALAALSGPAGAGLSIAEGHGDQLAPHVRRSAGIVVRIYGTYIVLGIIALRLVGMDWFDAVNHALTALATGGFSTYTASIGHFDSAAIEVVIIVLMLLGATNFLTAYTLFKGKYRPVIRNGEIRVAAGAMVFIIPLVLVATTLPLYADSAKALRVAVFESVSAMSGTGFSTIAHIDWNAFGLLTAVTLMTLGGSSGSTAGGLKLVRVYIIVKALRWEFRRSFMPEHSVNQPAIWQGDKRGFITDQMLRSVALYVFVYITVLLSLTSIIALHGYDIDRSLFEAASTLGTVGLSVGVTSQDAPATMLWAQTFAMFLGRLEFFAVFIGVTKFVNDMLVMNKREGKATHSIK